MMIKKSLILTLLSTPVLGQRSNVLPGVASLFSGFSDLIAGPCNTKPDGCLDFFEGWYMHNGTSGTSDCRTTCIKFPSVRTDLKCGMCGAVVETVESTKPPVASSLAEPAPFFAIMAAPSPSVAPVAMEVAPTTVPSPTVATTSALSEEEIARFKSLFDKLPKIGEGEVSSIPTSFPSAAPLAAAMSATPLVAPSVVPSTAPSAKESEIVPVASAVDMTSSPLSITSTMESEALKTSLFPTSIPSEIPSETKLVVSADDLTSAPSSISFNLESEVPVDVLISSIPTSINSAVQSDVPSNMPSDVVSDVPSDVATILPTEV